METQSRVNTRRIVLFGLVMTACILLTRIVTLTHNMGLHPDEHVFYLASDSLAKYLTGRASGFQEIKEYPEGAIILLAPFHLLGMAVTALSGISAPPQVWGRIGSLVYFILGAWVGLVLMVKYFGRSRSALAVYCATVVFSLLHLEQSRYGTGESLSFFLLTLLLLLSADALSDGAGRPFGKLCAASFLTGLLGAVKYPQVFFFAIPCFALFRLVGKSWWKSKRFFLMLLLLLAGFLAVSPKLLASPYQFLFHLIAKESHAYVRYGNPCEIGGPINHLLSLTVYFTLYSALPASPVFLWAGIKKAGPDRDGTDHQKALFCRFLPVLLGVFFLYNLFAKSLFMRTYYPFFFLSDLYVAAAAGKWLERGGWRRAAVAAAVLVLVLRGGANVAAMTEDTGTARLQAIVNASVTDSWNKTTLLLPGHFLEIDYTGLKAPVNLDLTFEESPGELESGELVIASTLDHSRANHYIVPPFNRDVKDIIRRWDDFKAVNEKYRVGSVYPEYYYWLFGYWVKGTTGTDYEFPTNTIYYKP
ncbi:MAG: glycosyltransferase family 39 protein [Oscillospiraceae bacterium]|nr:glycosyltransferase family 39 protein [Oscillospiraceae bacterium]